MAGGDGEAVSAAPQFFIGQRVVKGASISDKNPQVGTVKYVGVVEGYNGPWIGVDWDFGPASHDGSFRGVRYFFADSDASGSFVRPHVLQDPACYLTFIDAMVLRYKTESKDLEDDMYLLSVHQKRVAVELVGKAKIEKKLKQFEELTSASLIYANISSPGEIQNALPCLKELDLTGNLLPDWNTVSNLCSELPALRYLNLSRNKLQMGNGSLSGLARLQALILNQCHINWGQIEMLKHSLPNLEELHLSANNIKIIEVADGCQYVEGFKCLRLLNLEYNCIEAWEELVKLSKLERLEQLQVGYNKLNKIFYPVENAFKAFNSLRCLLLAGNRIKDWGSIDALDQFPSLKEVRLSDNPLTDLNAGGAPRYLFVARLRKVSILNGSEVRQRERKDSEIRYVHHVMSTMPTSDTSERILAHPRYLELKELYDLDEDQMESRKGGGSEKMASSLRVITLECVAPSVGEKAPVTKKLPLSTTIGKLKLICEALFKVKASKQRLYIRDKDEPIPMLIDEDLETLGETGIGADCVILYLISTRGFTLQQP